ncbi:AAA family ATPase [Mycobacterium colombiense]|nr:AAA family ATPase [Mycobacterium colombiense]
MLTDVNKVVPVTVTGEVAGTPDQDERERAVIAELDRLRVREEARKRLAAEKAGPALPFEWGLLDDFKDCAEPPYRIEGLLPAGGGMVVVAQRKTGKTTLVLNLAHSLITGDPFLGMFTTKFAAGRVAIVNYEVSGPQVARWAKQMDIPGDRLLLVNLRGRRNPLLHKEDRDQLAEKLREHNVETLIVDPFGRAYTGTSQNDSAEVGAWLTDLDVFARSEVGANEVILTVHAGWNGERARGSSAIEDWADSIVTMTFGDDQKSRYLRAMGRDVSVDEDLLHYDPTTRLLGMTGSGGRAEAKRDAKAAALLNPVCQHLGKEPGASGSAIGKAMRALRNNGGLEVAFQDADVRAAIELGVKKGKIRLDRLGPGRPTRHYLTAEETLSNPTLSGQGQP